MRASIAALATAGLLALGAHVLLRPAPVAAPRGAPVSPDAPKAKPDPPKVSHADIVPTPFAFESIEARDPERVRPPPAVPVRVRGTIVDADGRPVASGRVVSRALGDRDDGWKRMIPQFGPRSLEACRIGGDGRFTMELSEPGPWVVIAEAPPHAPWGCVVDAAGEAERVLGEIRLAPGLTIRGYVRLLDGTPVAAADVTLELAGHRTEEIFDVGGLGWTGRAVVPLEGATSDWQGCFEIGGLGAEPVTLRASGGWADDIDAMRATAGAPRIDVRPPAVAVALDVPSARLEVRVRTPEGDGVRDAIVRAPPGAAWSRADGAVMTDATGTGVMLVAPDQPLVLGAWTRGRIPATVEVPPLPSGAVHVAQIVLPPVRIPPEVRVRLEHPRGDAIACAEIAEIEGGGCIIIEHSRFLTPEDGVFVVRDLDPGQRHLVIRPGAQRQATPGQYLEEHATLDVPFDGVIEVRVPVRPAGHLRVRARAPSGAWLAGTHALERDGEFLISRLECPIDASREDSWRAEFDPLAPGAYRLRVSALGYRAVVLDLTIEEGRTLDITPTLEPE